MGSTGVGNGEFSFDVFNALQAQHAQENIFCSPLSILSTMIMVYLGARGNTQTQMAKVLHLDNGTGTGAITHLQSLPQCDTPEDLHSSLKDLLSDFNKTNASYSLGIADKLYIEKTYPVIPEYIECIKEFLKVDVEEVNFKTAAEEVRQAINSWVEKQTSGQIKDLVAPGSVGVDTALVVLDAIYFKGTWRSAFKKEDTQEVPFYVTKQESKPVKMMCQNGTFRLSKVPEEKIKILELPYSDGELSMLVLLPDDISGLEQLEKKTSFDKVIEWTNPNVMEKKRVQVYLPRMKFEAKYNLTSILVSLGMTDLFSPLANLSGISSAKGLKLSEAIYAARLEVDEEGTSTSGTGAVVGEVKDSPDFLEIEEFRADHPFVFLIRYNPTDSILFLGRYASP